MARHAKSKDTPPPPMVVRTSLGLRPVSAYDEEALQRWPIGTMFDTTPRKARSNKQMRLYWQILNTVCKITEQWPRAENLHRDLKLSLGYTTPAYDFTNKTRVDIPDSTDFNRMSQPDFNIYFERAMALLAEEIGCDPTELKG